MLREASFYIGLSQHDWLRFHAQWEAASTTNVDTAKSPIIEQLHSQPTNRDRVMIRVSNNRIIDPITPFEQLLIN